MSEIKTGDKVAFNFVQRATFLYYRILKSASNPGLMSEKNRAYYRQHDRGRYYFCGSFTWFAKEEPPAEKTSTAERKSYSGTTRCIPIRGSINQGNAVYGYGSGAEICR